MQRAAANLGSVASIWLATFICEGMGLTDDVLTTAVHINLDCFWQRLDSLGLQRHNHMKIRQIIQNRLKL
jgi:hypothetical protein